MPFSITREWVKGRLTAGVCEVTGLPLNLASLARGSGHQHPWAPSLDRHDPALGYTPENTRVVVWMFNAAKHVGTDADVMTLAKALCRTQ